jgi:DNA primase
MPGRIRSEDIDQVRSRADIVQVVGQYLQLRKAGRDSMVGLCPFHQEKTPSFNVSVAKQVYHCHGCDASGNVFRFLQNVENLSFPEAVERLAGQVGVTLRYEGLTKEDRQAFSRKKALHAANDEAAEIYHQFLIEGKAGEEARAYLSGRGITPETAKAFQLGLSPNQGDFLLRRLTGGGKFSPELLIEAGLASQGSDGRVFDRFRGRLMFPTWDLTGQAVGFGGRILGEGQPKYLNTAETPVFHKGELMYHLDRAKNDIAAGGRAVVVEGYTDVILLEQAGIKGAVATNGTALGEGHFRLLSRFAQKAVLVFDPDEAGGRAAARAYEFHERHSVEPLVLILSGGLDPADFVQQRGAQAFEAELARAVPLVEYMLERALAAVPAESIEDRVRAVRAGLPIVMGLTDSVRREQYASLLADRVGVAVETVLTEMSRTPAAPGSGGNREAEPAVAVRGTREQKVEREALRLLLQAEEREPLEKLVADHFSVALHRRAFELIRERGPGVADWIADVDDERLANLLTGSAVDELEGDPGREYAEDVWRRLEEFALSRRIALVRKRLEPLNPTVDPAAYDVIFQELIELEAGRRRLRGDGAEPAS